MLRRSKTDKAAAAAAESLAHDSGNGVVVVNDDDDARELLCRVVARHGSVPVPAYDIDSTVTALSSASGLAAVILDLSTGTAASFSVLDAVRQTMNELGQPMPAIMMIATTAANRTLAFDAGVDEFLTRPFHVDELTAALGAMTLRTPDERAALRTQASLAGRGLTDLQD